MLKNQIQTASRNEKRATRAITFAIIDAIGLIMSIAPLEIASNTLLKFLNRFKDIAISLGYNF